MFTGTDYEAAEQIYESANSIVYRAVRGSDRRPVILKVLKDQRPAPEVIARFKREYVLLRELSLPGVIRVHDCVRTADHWTIVEEDFGATSMARLKLAGEIAIERFLELAIAI